MKNLKTRLADHLRSYFNTGFKRYGLCKHFGDYDYYNGYEFYPLFKKYAQRWPSALKCEDGSLASYFIPVSRDNPSFDDAATLYCDRSLNKTEHPLRRECANFILREIAREQKKKFVPIA